jgi:peptide/nickel transport system substrate-binding protein
VIGEAKVTMQVAALMLMLTLVTSGCVGPNQLSQRVPEDTHRAGSVETPKVLTLGLDEDLRNLWSAVTDGGGGGEGEKVLPVVHQPLTANTADGSAQPRLLRELPSIQGGTWTVFEDGSMETIWRLRSASWHDGTPFTARDVLFSYQVYRDPDLPNSRQEIVKSIAGMEQTDPTTVVVKWSETYPYADRMELRELLILPAHVLEARYVESKAELLNHPYFTTEYVGLGPFRITAWERGSHLELAAFDQFFLGRPRLDRIYVKFIPDSNTLIANLKAGAVQSTFGSKKLDRDSLRALRQEWEARSEGTVMVFPSNYKFAEVQKLYSPQPADLTDVRVRRALLHALDRQELARAAWEDRGLVADSWVNPTFPRYQDVKDSIAQYPYDVRRASALLDEVGWRRGPDQMLQKDGKPFALTIRDMEGEKQPLIVADYWKAIGVSGTYEYESPAQLQDRQWRATFSGVVMYRNGTDLVNVAQRIATSNIPTPGNRWTGSNRGGYSNSEWDEVSSRAVATLNDRTRLDLERRLLEIYTSDLPLLPLFFHFEELPVARSLTGIVPHTGAAPNTVTYLTWNVHEWDVKA